MGLKFDDHQCDFCSNMSEKTDNYSADRPPHLNRSNVSSQQKASTTAAELSLELAAAMHAQLRVGVDGDEREPDYPKDHKPPSHVSNGTASTDATAVANLDHSNAIFTTPAFNFASRGLTESVLARHQHELQLVQPGDMGAWLEGTAPGYAHLAIAHHRMGHGRGGAPQSKPSQASDASYEFVSPPTTQAGQNQDVLAVGALFDEEAANPYLYSRLEM